MENDYAEDVNGVRVVRWNPVVGDAGRVDNFGDLLGPLVVRQLAPTARSLLADERSLLAIGSITQFAEPGDVVWGSGINAKLHARRLDPRRVFDVRAVRGPLTAVALETEGSVVPDVHGDPGLLLPLLFPETRTWADPARRRHDVVVVPNVNDVTLDADGHPVVAPTGRPWDVIEAILGAGLVVATSLHAIVTAEAYGIPARAVRSASESPVKYVDYYEGTGRRGVVIADSVAEAVALGGAGPLGDGIDDGLLAAFPSDLWDGSNRPAPSAGPRSLGDLVATVTDRTLGATVDAERAAWTALAQRLVLPVLRDRADVLEDDELDRVVMDVRRLDGAGLFAGLDPRWERTLVLARYRLGADLRRSAFLNAHGAQSVLDTVERAGDDGVLHLGGTLQLPDGRLDETTCTLFLTDDTLTERLQLEDVVWDEVAPTVGTVRWTAAVDLDSVPDGSWFVVAQLTGTGGAHDVVSRSAPTVAFPRWWWDDRPYRVDRTSRGNAVLHKDGGAQ